MIEHIGIRDKSISLNSLNLDPENSTTHHHADFTILLQSELCILWYFVTNHLVVLFDIFDFF